jgi:ATP-binding cassette, subfamily B, multidrug efflux pump
MAKPKQKTFDSKVLKRIFSYTNPYRNTFLVSLALAIFLSLLTPIRPYLVQKSIDSYIKPFASAHVLNLFTQLLFWQILILVIETGIRFYFTYLSAKLGQLVVLDVRKQVFGKIMSYNLKQFDTTPIGTLTTRTVSDVEAVNDIFSDGLIPIVADFLSIICVLTYMFITDWQLTFICLIPFPIILLATYFFKESVNKSFTAVRNAVSNLNAFVQEHITGMFITQAFAAEERELQKFKKINNEHRAANIKAILAYSIFFPVVEIVLALSIGLLVWYVAGHKGQPGVIMSFVLCLNAIFRPLRVIADKFNVLQMGVIAGARIFNVIDNDDVLQDNGTLTPTITKGAIAFDKVNFYYTSPEQPILKNISFNLEAGKTLAIVGNTGSGKTTITSLINRLYQHQSGAITIDGNNIEIFKIEALRKQVAVVLQDVFLFNGSIKDNILLQQAHISDEQMIAAAKMIGLHDFIMQLPGGYNFNVGERGNALSQGQRQLISFIRALIYNPAILILDEATSNIDTESELLIQKAISTLVKDRTAIVIAHRLSTIRNADEIMVLEKGAIEEIGTHENLLKQEGLYAQLYLTQLKSSFSKKTETV